MRKLKLGLSDLKAKLPMQRVNGFLSSTAIEDDLLNLCEETYRLGFKDAADLEKKELPNVPMQWLTSELFDPLVNGKPMEALGDLFRASCIEQYSLQHLV
ncbi:hypothetical protein ACH5RR_001517 [Cinchona calisaya]|uniref:Uncharacterized protein n=1 Tax=Cinchona calisaya TaxID=153742 RepID=A0ABD3B421_9GENT